MKKYRIDAELGIVYGIRGKPIRKLTSCGYIQTQTSRGHVGMAHRMIWEHVHGPIPDDLEINHKNGIKTDNRIANLELVTPSENVKHAYATGLKSAVGEKNGRAKLTAADVRLIRSEPMDSSALASRFSVSRATIRGIRAGRLWRHL